jgi:putative endonuclease
MNYYVYILASFRRVLYIGVTSNLERRISEHRNRLVPGFTARYQVVSLVYYESTPDVYAAIAREKQLKSWRRSKKVALIETHNPNWHDLSESWQ